MLDFNHTDTERHTPAPAIEVKCALIARIEPALAHLFPNGRIRDGQFEIGDVNGNIGDSLKIDLEGVKSGLWYDFATGDGGDIFDLWAERHQLDVKTQFLSVLDSINAWLGGSGCNVNQSQTKPKRKAQEDLGAYTGKWNYHDGDGNLIACVYRYDTPTGKQYRPWDVLTRKCCSPIPRPLYNQPGIKDAHYVVLVEGEKSADALISQGVVATTAMQGANAALDKTDWAPLKGKHVIIWPDNDDAGRKYAAVLRQFFENTELLAALDILSIPGDKPEKWDAADAVKERIKVIKFICENRRTIYET